MIARTGAKGGTPMDCSTKYKDDIDDFYDCYLEICRLITRVINLENDPKYNPISKHCVRDSIKETV